MNSDKKNLPLKSYSLKDVKLFLVNKVEKLEIHVIKSDEIKEVREYTLSKNIIKMETLF